MIYTAQDVVDYLLTATGGGGQDGEARAVRQAVIAGAREVLQARDWLWHTKTGWFLTNAVTATAQVTKDSNQITVNSAASMVPGRILYFDALCFGNRVVRVTSVSGLTVTVDYTADATVSNALVRVQTYYDLPDNLKDIDALVTDTVGTLHCYITPQEWQRLEVNTKGAGEPFYYTIMRSDTNPDRYQIRFVGVPTNNTLVHYTYRYIPQPLRLLGYEATCRQGTVTIAANSTTVTGTGTAFPEACVGSLIRFGTATTEAEPLGALTPFVAQRNITARASTTSLTIDTAMTAATTVKYAITDILDCSPQMYTAILSASEMWYARLAGKSAADPMAMFNRDMRLAMESDAVSPLAGRPKDIGYPTPRTQGWHSPQLPDQG